MCGARGLRLTYIVGALSNLSAVGHFTLPGPRCAGTPARDDPRPLRAAFGTVRGACWLPRSPLLLGRVARYLLHVAALSEIGLLPSCPASPWLLPAPGARAPLTSTPLASLRVPRGSGVAAGAPPVVGGHLAPPKRPGRCFGKRPGRGTRLGWLGCQGAVQFFAAVWARRLRCEGLRPDIIVRTFGQFGKSCNFVQCRSFYPLQNAHLPVRRGQPAQRGSCRRPPRARY